MNRVAYVSTYLPKKCGLATYTHHLRESVAAAKTWPQPDLVIALLDRDDQKPNEDVWTLVKDDRDAYRRMAEALNASDVSVVSLQHEFGIFGGEAGEYVIDFVRYLRKPLITTFHTVFEQPPEPYRSIQRAIADKSDRIVVMNRKAISYVQNAFDLDKEKLGFIPHGAPLPRTEHRERYREQLGWSGRKVLMTFGLLSRGKGIELVLKTLPAVSKAVPEVLYAIVGQTHPEVKKREGESYREQLQAIIREKGLKEHVVMIDRYVDEEELVTYLTACDLYITPYPGVQQITSGTLAYAVGLGRPVLSTPYSYAQDLLAGHEELLIPYEQESLWAEKLLECLAKPNRLGEWEQHIRTIGEAMHWPRVGEQHVRLFTETAKTAASVHAQTVAVHAGAAPVR